jgi:hypothetical protein
MGNAGLDNTACPEPASVRSEMLLIFWHNIQVFPFVTQEKL